MPAFAGEPHACLTGKQAGERALRWPAPWTGTLGGALAEGRLPYIACHCWRSVRAPHCSSAHLLLPPDKLCVGPQRSEVRSLRRSRGMR